MKLSFDVQWIHEPSRPSRPMVRNSDIYQRLMVCCGVHHFLWLNESRAGGPKMENVFNVLQSRSNVGTTIVNHPPLIFLLFCFFLGGGRFAIVNFRSQLSPQIKKTNQNHSTTIKRIKKKEKNQCEPKELFIIVRIYTYL